MNINLHIERLILDGLQVGRNQEPHVQAAVEAELTRLLSENGLASHFKTGGAVPRLDASAMHLTASSSPIQMGTQIARSVYSGMGSKG
jgi:hypothetical protein